MKEKTKNIKIIILITSLITYTYLALIGTNQYIFNITYTKIITFMILLTLFTYSQGIIENKEKTYKTNINIYIFLYIILLITITFFIGRTNIKFYNWCYTGQYKPLYTITKQIHYGTKLLIAKNIIGNSIMLIPISFLLMIKNKKYNNIFKQSIIILPIIIIIEILQAYTHTGVFDIDDIILNYLGIIIFTFLITRFNLINKIRNIFYTDFKIKDNIKYTIFYIVSTLLIAYIILLTFKCF